MWLEKPEEERVCRSVFVNNVIIKSFQRGKRAISEYCTVAKFKFEDRKRGRYHLADGQ